MCVCVFLMGGEGRDLIKNTQFTDVILSAYLILPIAYGAGRFQISQGESME